MKPIRMLVLTGLALFAAGISRADVLHLDINLNDDGIYQSDGGGVGAWNGNDGATPQTFNLSFSANDLSTAGFTGPTICTDQYGDVVECGDPSDASIHVNNGGNSGAPPPTFTSDAEGGGSFDYFFPSTVNSVTITTTYPDGSSVFGGPDGTSFVCTTDQFAFCGFEITGDDKTLTGIWTNYAVPEPSYEVVFLTASGWIFWAGKKRLSKRV